MTICEVSFENSNNSKIPNSNRFKNHIDKVGFQIIKLSKYLLHRLLEMSSPFPTPLFSIQSLFKKTIFNLR